MVGAHPLADLAPRDVVSATIAAHLRATGDDHVFLDATAPGRGLPDPPLPRHRRAPAAPPGSTSTREPVPGRAGRPLRLRRGARRPRRPHQRAPGSSPSARSRAPASRAPTGWRRTPSPRGWSPPAGAPRCWPRTCPPPASRSPAAAGEAIDPAARSTITAAMSRDAGVLRDGAGLAHLAGVLAAVPAPGRPPAGPRRGRDDGAAHGGVPARRRGVGPHRRAAAATAAPTHPAPGRSGRSAWCTGSTGPAACTPAPSRSGTLVGRVAA